MTANQVPVSIGVAIAVLALVGSCQDMGDEVRKGLTASTFSVSLAPGGSATVTIVGGTPPYRISRQPNSSVATASLTNSSNGNGQLLITAAANVSAAQTTEVRIADSDRHETLIDGPTHEESEIAIAISVSPSPPVSFSGQIQPILTNRCVDEGCHPGRSAPFSLRSGQSYANLVNVPATNATCAQLRVNPGSTGSSVLYLRLLGTACGNQMPLGLAPLQTNDMDLIRDWINQGAMNN